MINGQPRKGIAEAGKAGWVYLLDRTDGKPLIGIDERPVPQEPRQKTAETQPYPVGDAVMPQCALPFGDYEKAGCLFEPFWEEPVLIQPGPGGGTVWVTGACAARSRKPYPFSSAMPPSLINARAALLSEEGRDRARLASRD